MPSSRCTCQCQLGHVAVIFCDAAHSCDRLRLIPGVQTRFCEGHQAIYGRSLLLCSRTSSHTSQVKNLGANSVTSERFVCFRCPLFVIVSYLSTSVTSVRVSDGSSPGNSGSGECYLFLQQLAHQLTVFLTSRRIPPSFFRLQLAVFFEHPTTRRRRCRSNQPARKHRQVASENVQQQLCSYVTVPFKMLSRLSVECASFRNCQIHSVLLSSPYFVRTAVAHSQVPSPFTKKTETPNIYSSTPQGVEHVVSPHGVHTAYSAKYAVQPTFMRRALTASLFRHCKPGRTHNSAAAGASFIGNYYQRGVAYAW